MTKLGVRASFLAIFASLMVCLGSASISYAYGSPGPLYQGMSDTLIASETLQEEPFDIAQAIVYVEEDNVYTGKKVKPYVDVEYDGEYLFENEDYTVSYANNIAVGKNASVTIRGIGNYTGLITSTFEILQADIDDAAASIGKQVYTGKALTPSATVKYEGKVLQEGVDYTVSSFRNNVSAGTATAVLKGAGSFRGKKAVSFKIGKASITESSVSDIADKVYTGKAFKPSPKVVFAGKKLVKGKDYSLTYKSNEKAGSAEIVIKGKGNFTDKLVTGFWIDKAQIAKASVASIGEKTYTGAFLKPAPKVRFAGRALKKGVDYTLSYKANKKVGTARVYVRGKGSFTGTKAVSFKIKRAQISGASVSGIGAKSYKGKALKPAPKVRFAGRALKKGVDYTLSYKANRNAGTAKVFIKGKGSFTGKKAVTFKIKKASLSGASISSIGSVDYTGGEIKPKPSVKVGGIVLSKGKDYSLSYRDNVYAGTAKVIVKGKGNYSGSKTVRFRINEPAPEPEPEPDYGWNSGWDGGGDIVYITNSGSKYHRDGCRYLYSRYAISRSDAIAQGYEACKVCKP